MSPKGRQKVADPFLSSNLVSNQKKTAKSCRGHFGRQKVAIVKKDGKKSWHLHSPLVNKKLRRSPFFRHYSEFRYSGFRYSSRYLYSFFLLSISAALTSFTLTVVIGLIVSAVPSSPSVDRSGQKLNICQSALL